MNVVPRVNTPKTLAEIARALEASHQRIFGLPLSRGGAELLTAQILIETANGKSIQNNSPGNVSASAKYSGDAWRPTWFEEPTEETSARDRALHAKMLAGGAPSAFRAFASFDLGVDDYLRILKRNFPAILLAKNPRQLAEAIFNSNYTRDVTPNQSEPGLRRLVEDVRRAGVFSHLEDTRSLGGFLEAGAYVLGLIAVVKFAKKASGGHE